MDGNGRWAKAHHRPRAFGHKAGMDNVKTITKAASQMGVKVLTLYAFSTENWRRPTDEVNYLMQLPIDFFNTFLPELMAENVQVKVMGFLDQLPEKTRQVTYDAKAQTAANTGMILNFALNYGSRAEITVAVQELAQEVAAGRLTPEQIDEQQISQHLMTSDLGRFADPDLLIRTSGELRLSNFLLWQLAYSEFYFVDVHWPDFSQQDLAQAVAAYQQRQRRYGGLA
ncbi:isoprenyl transferase [Lapidilactobacillus achengensis]|uniref:Isoprenyl transferase n=1 Tax=Lapidilactobacillus achengensis TaxID=2486000 RepID=A0ABW1UPZ2_9LACO